MLWHIMLTLVGVKWVFPSMVRESFLCWNESFVGKKRKKAWMTTPLCLFWTIWCERNTIAFENEEVLGHQMKTSFFYVISGPGLFYV